MKKSTLLVLSILLLTAFIPGAAFAASPWTEKTTWSDKATAKLDFGFKNVFGGFTEIYTQPTKAHKDKTCVVKGLGKGIAYAVADTLGGALHIVTFPIVDLDVPLPENGINL